ncbi:MAG TPA: DEAD/DEAH box helicase [Acidimicrobiales bacterium]|nr:DEAD/DEAH box helicase [Acidimicrobiales bacterium]
MAPTPGGGGTRAGFAAGLGFAMDHFQVEALDALDDGASVVVAAPTGSGKTVVAEYAVATALAAGAKAFYTTPLKALSNQKYLDLVDRHGADTVGLLTGDNTINPGAPVLVMTTEILRNMIYAASPALHGLRYAILDEVHYLQNAYRGPVWEEVIVHAPPGADLVCLSATVSNADELADWIRTVRGHTVAVVEERRPVELIDLYLVGDRSSDRLLLLPTLVDSNPNAEALALEGAPPRPGSHQPRRRSRVYTPRRTETISVLDEAGMLPAIYFIFSRKACDEAAAALTREHRRLTTADERRQVRAIVEDHVGGLGGEDLQLLGYGSWLAGLEAGFAAHHAGLVPPFKEAVEACFAAGLVKVVFATETLALGINMPARSVVLEKLTKWTGDRHEPLTAGEYVQLTGRAGRRGIDDVGYAVVLRSPFVPFDQVAALAGARTYALTSSFRPTYNMAANLVRRYPPDVARHLLNLSFAQYQTDGEVVRIEARLERAETARAQALAAAACERGDVTEYRRLLDTTDGRVAPAVRSAVAAELGRVRPGDVLVAHGSRVAVLSTSRRKGGEPKLRVVTPERRMLQLGPGDFPAPPRTLGRVELPSPFAPNNAAFRRRVASALTAARLDGPITAPAANGADRLERTDEVDAADHPVASCPSLRSHLRALERADRLEREIERLRRRVTGRSESLARQFDRVLQVLESWGYVEGWALSAKGERLARIYQECDLLVTECLDEGLLDGLGVGDLAGLASVFSFESRGPADARAVPPSLRERVAAVATVAARLNAAEAAAGLPLTRLPDPGFAALARRWASGDELGAILADEDISGGDFVRNVKQLVDLLRQLGDHAPDPVTASTARSAADRLVRGVVAASSVVAR